MCGEDGYLELLRELLVLQKQRPDRTGTGVVSVFGRQLRFDIAETVPLITTKLVNWKSVIEELLWFLKGCTDSKVLEAKGVNIWRGNTSREFLDANGLPDYREGDCGPMYGFQWRHFGAEYTGCDTSYSSSDGVDQLEEVVRMLKEDPFSRRIMMTTYNVNDRNKGVLYPCHGVVVQFFCEDDTDDNGQNVRRLSCHMYQRSMDTFLGAPYNIFSYSVLTYILALKSGMVPKELVISTGDTHLYMDHIEQAKLQTTRVPFHAPRLELDPRIEHLSWQEIEVEHFNVIDYKHHAFIKARMSA
jgi:thymidylate synthase